MNVLRGLYAITPDPSPGCGPLSAMVSAAIAGGARVIQYRDKSDDRVRRRREVTALLDVCHPAGVPLLINDDVALAAEIGADGVHIGRADLPLARARAALGDQAIIGVSCYNDLALARAAHDSGATYAAFGSFLRPPPNRRRCMPMSRCSHERSKSSRFPWLRSAASRPRMAAR